MKFRMVTATVAVALGAWSGVVLLAQSQENGPQENVSQEDILDFVDPAQGFDRALQSEMPLQGVFDDAAIPGAGAESSSPLAPAAAPATGRLGELQRLLRDSPREIAVTAVGLLALLGAGWMLSSMVLRRRARRASRRFPRSSGGARAKSLEQVVASVQRGRTKRVARPPL